MAHDYVALIARDGTALLKPGEVVSGALFVRPRGYVGRVMLSSAVFAVISIALTEGLKAGAVVVGAIAGLLTFVLVDQLGGKATGRLRAGLAHPLRQDRGFLVVTGRRVFFVEIGVTRALRGVTQADAQWRPAQLGDVTEKGVRIVMAFADGSDVALRAFGDRAQFAGAVRALRTQVG